MLARMAAAAALIALGACAGMESAGRNARTGEPTRVASAPPPAARPAPPPAAATLPPPAAQTPTPSASAPTPAPAAARPLPAPPPQRVEAAPPPDEDEPVATRSRGGDVVVPGARQRQVPAPGGDPRSNSQRMEDIRSWDHCVMRVQNAGEADPMRPQLTTPEEYCSQSLGMADRMAVPASRLEQQR